jgi:hypothetical protein
MIYTHVLNRGGEGVHSPLDRLRKPVSVERGDLGRTRAGRPRRVPGSMVAWNRELATRSPLHQCLHQGGNWVYSGLEAGVQSGDGRAGDQCLS